MHKVRELSEPAVTSFSATGAEYGRRLRLQSDRAARLTKLHRLAVLLRRLFFGAVVILAVLTELEHLLVKVVIVGMPAVGLECLMFWRMRVSRDRSRAATAAAFYEWRLACLDGRWAGSGASGTCYLDDGHPYALDLDLFGAGGLFELLNTAATRSGEDTLAAWLLTPGPAERVRDRQAAVAELRSRLDLREDLAILRGEGAAGASLTALTQWGRKGSTGIPPWARPLALFLSGATLMALAGFCLFSNWPTLVVGLLVVGGLLALSLRPRIRPLINTVRHLDEKLYAFAAVFGRLERESFTTSYLVQLRADLDLGGKPASRALTQLARLVRRLNTAPLYFAVLGTTRVALAIDAWRGRFGQTLARSLNALAELDALNALAGYAFENPQDPFPEVTARAPCLDGVGLGHPLLPRDGCVRNDVRLGGDLSVLVVSGSNMSGKSTLLRTVGVNAVLALAGAPVRAVHLRLSPLAIGATLRVQDSLQAGRSRFQAEVRRIRKLLEMAQGKTQLLFLLDELFQGTNSHDRRIGAEALVRQLVASGAIGMVTTHDLALTEFADHPASRGANVHFVDQFEDGVMTFDYRLRPGVVPKSNALALLRAVGITV
jgi:MutS domain V